MTDEEKIEAVAAKLTGQFYVGQRVRHSPTKWTATIVALKTGYYGYGSNAPGAVLVWDDPEHGTGMYEYAQWALEPL